MFYSIIPIWVVVKIMVSLWFPVPIRHPIFNVPKKGGPLILGSTHIELQSIFPTLQTEIVGHLKCETAKRMLALANTEH